jgi:hypothetical protein
MLLSTDGPFELKIRGTRPRVDSLWLKPQHDLTTHYLKLAGVTEERLRNPITTFVLERHLLSLAEYDQAFVQVDGYVPLTSEDGPHQWVSESIWNGEYRTLLENPVVFQEGAEAGVAEEATVLVLSTGPHWIAREVSTRRVSDEDLLRGYGNMVSSTEPGTRVSLIRGPGRRRNENPDRIVGAQGQDMVPFVRARTYGGRHIHAARHTQLALKLADAV